MNSPLDVEWTNRSLRNAQNIREYLASEFTNKEIHDFEDLLRHLEDTVSIFPKIYPASTKYPSLRRAVLQTAMSPSLIFITLR